MKKRVTVYWLTPAPPEAELFRDIIRILARQFNAPRFEPHLTLGEAPQGDSPRRTLRDIRFAPIRLTITGIKQSSKFTQTVVVRFSPNKTLDRLVTAIGEAKSLRNPHVSLIYKTMPAATRRDLAHAIQLPFRHVTFDRIKAVSCVVPTKTERDVRAWRLLTTHRLSY
ncbi:MAG TPA: hypothetical protein VJ719_05160 [Chthoniobacterales bacterium]|nr:hypothetical protein [Chthoniobacterales bacterium]